ncbi:hypothetical protein [Dongia deserti]|uniref:hypothetical protein n=1 Tax=Dongia deserti TaxID=2268030 RepID=UPI0013C4AB3D|nr:hypothetical protein [Dongia deserti]
MIRKVSSQAYCLHPRTVARNFGGWEAGLYRARAASVDSEKAMQVFKHQRAPVPLQPKQRRNESW